MKFISLNIRGIGRVEKKRAFRRFLTKEKPSLVLLQEMKIGLFFNKINSQLWCQSNIGSVYSEAVGSAGGLLCMWDDRCFQLSSSLVNERFILLKGKFIGYDLTFNFINLYGPNEENERVLFWNELAALKINNDELWCYVGDFNAVLCADERRGTTDVSRTIQNFAAFVHNSDLVDLPMNGRKFTWMRRNSSSMSRLDRFLLSSNWFLYFSTINQ